MYSLYRAWFGGEETYHPRLEALSPPDTLIRVGNDGEHQFVAHRGVLAAHSGYLKALLATSSTTTSSSSSDNFPNVTSLSVSSVGGEAFAPLLNYMYTGRLEVTLDNIYSVLLATHLLHMPGALEQCRAALLRLRAPPALPTVTSPPRAGNILRPVPNRLMVPPLCWPQPSLYPPPSVGLSHLPPTLPFPTAIPMFPTPMMHETHESAAPFYSTREDSRSPTSSIRSSHKVHERSRSSSPEEEVASQPEINVEQLSEDAKHSEDKSSTTRHKGLARKCSPSPSGSSERTSVVDLVVTTRRRTKSSRASQELDSGSSSTAGTSVVIDVACCDGPVKFHRVLNEKYSASSGNNNPLPSRVSTPTPRHRSCEEEPAGRMENDENGRPNEADQQHDSSGHGSFTCSYCKHTFKSQYCYRKHARRHLLPTEPTPDASSPESVVTATAVASNNRPSDSNVVCKREVRLLDLNVQYYPCKICGSKFPSYYFVHKHRKLCHANVDERQPRSSGDEDVGNQGTATSNSA